MIALLEPIQRLAKRGHKITLLAFDTRDAQTWSSLELYCRIITVPHDTTNRVIPAALNVLLPIPYVISKYKSSALATQMEKLLDTESFDLVHLEFLYMGHYLSIPKARDIPVLLRQQNVESVIWEKLGREGSGLLRLFAKMQVPKVRRFETSMCEQADACLAITENDARTLKGMNPRINTIVLPSGVDLEFFGPPNDVSEESCSLVYIGSMDYFPNADAVLWFTQEVLPLIKSRFPKLKLTIVGRNPPLSVLQLSNGEDIIVTGTVDDVREYMAKATVFIVPLRVGGGIRIKLLQAMAMGKATVSTSTGAEGIDVADGRDILLADTASDFSRCVIDLLLDENKRRVIGQNARSMVEKSYGWDAIISRTEEIYSRFIDRKSTAR